MQFLEYHEVNQYTSDGREVFMTVNFKNQDEASKYVNSKGKSKNYYSSQKKSIIIYESMNDYESNTPEEIKKRALEKLTPEEIKILNLS